MFPKEIVVQASKIAVQAFLWETRGRDTCKDIYSYVDINRLFI